MFKKYLGIAFTVLFIFVLSYGVHIRVHALQERKGYSGGDAFNFLYASRALLHADYPKDERRLPFFPAVLTPYAYSPNALDYAKNISLISGIATVLLTVFFTYKLFKSKLATTVSGLLVSFNIVLIIASSRPLADSLFIFLTLLELFLTYEFIEKKKSIKRIIVFGVVLGCTALTRFEGMLTGFIIVSFLFIFGAKYRKQAFQLGVTAFLVMLPWFIRNIIVFGNPFFTSYFGESAGGYGTTTFGLLKLRMVEGFNNLLTIFFHWNMLDLIAAAHIIPSFDITFADKYTHVSNLFPGIMLALIGLTFFVSIGIGAIYIFKRWKLYGVISFLCAFALFAIANWWTPRGRFYASQIPIFIIMSSAGFSILFHFVQKKLKKFDWILYLLLAYSFFRIILVMDTANNDRIKAEAEGSRDTFVFIEAAKYLGSIDKKTYALGLPHNYDLLFYKKDVIFIPKNDKKEINCPKKECLFYVVNTKKVESTKYNNTKLRLINSFYQPNSKQYILIYTNE